MISRRFSKRDANHAVIVRALRSAGRHVVELFALGGSHPDIVVVWPGGIVFMEIKAPGGKLTPGQVQYHGGWRGPAGSLVVVRDEHEALTAAGVIH